MLNNKSLRNRLILAFLFIILFVYVMFEIAFSIGIKNFYYKTIEKSLVERINLNLKIYQSYRFYNDIHKVSKFLIENTEIPNYVNMKIFDDEANIVGSNTIFLDERIEKSFIKTVIKNGIQIYIGKNINNKNEDVMAVFVPIRFEKGTGVLTYSTSLKEIDKAILHYMIISGFVGILIVILAIIISYRLSNTIVEPINALKNGADKISNGDLSIKVNKYFDDEIGELTDTFNYMVDEIKKTDKMKHDFISSISHELRTPITSISGWAETILNMQSSEEKEEFSNMAFDIILKESNRLNILVEGLLDFSKLEANRITLDVITFDFIELMQEISNQIKPMMKKNNIVHLIGFSKQKKIYKGDRNRLKQVFINIYDNAIKYTPNGKIHTMINEINDYITIEIKDNGEGIPSEHLKNITKDFYKVNNNKNGSGIGLAIVKKIIVFHGGNIEFKSKEGEGTSVIVSLPLKYTILDSLS